MENWINVFINAFRFAIEIREKLSGSSQEVIIPPTPPSQPLQEMQAQGTVETYQAQLGRRHKFLRENILQLNPREMANFYGFEKVKQLEDCEAGLDEFPTEAIKRLEEKFFVSPKYLQEGENPIFRSFKLSYTRDDCRRFLEQGFHPYFLCDPSFQEDGLAYLVFWKEEEGYWRMICSNTVGSFYSSGGGKGNILNLIYSMLDLDLDLSWPNFSCLNVSAKEWEKLNDGCWYNKGMCGYVGAANNEASDIYERWFEDAQSKRMSRDKKFYLP